MMSRLSRTYVGCELINICTKFLKTIIDTFSRLTPNQIQKLLSQYQLAGSEQPVNEELMKAVTPKVTTGDGALLLQAVDLDSRPYEIAEPRTSTALGTYIPSRESEAAMWGIMALLTPPY